MTVLLLPVCLSALSQMRPIYSDTTAVVALGLARVAALRFK